MRFTTTISAETLSAHLGDPAWAILDCRFSLADPSAGRLAYHAAHIPGAVYVHLDDDLCAPMIPGKTGRHPLPPVEQLVENFSRWGIDRQTQVVVYDDHPGGSGAIAARCWWSLRYLGHAAAAVLDGGWQRWQAAGLPVQGGGEGRSRRQFIAQVQPAMLATVDEVQAARRDPAFRIFDSRGADRYRGENETIDPIAGHIPGAVSAPYPDNLDPTAHFRSKEELHRRFEDLFGAVPASQAIFYCGSGVTAAHNILAAVHAGFEMPRLYVGSWSEWIIDPQRPVAVGEDTD
jgi:thiosulfate/3-mercaptopyruvate sulfurtransferase